MDDMHMCRCGRFLVPNCCGEYLEDPQGLRHHTEAVCYRTSADRLVTEPINAEDQIRGRPGLSEDPFAEGAGTVWIGQLQGPGDHPATAWTGTVGANTYCIRCGRSLALHTYEEVPARLDGWPLFRRACP